MSARSCGDGFRTRPHRRLAVVATAMVAAVAVVVSGGVVTDAAWQDRESVHDSSVGAVHCDAADGAFATRGEGQLLSGSLLGVDLDALAIAHGVTVTNDSSAAQPEPARAAPAALPDAFADPLSVEALGALDLHFGQLLQLPLENDLGVVGQFGQARADGIAVGAGGAVTSSGAIALDSALDYPELAELRLSRLLEHVNAPVADALAGVADISLVTGAVTGRASLDGCAMAWTDDVAAAVTREYLAASVRTEIDSPTVDALVRAVGGTVDTLQVAVDGLIGREGVVPGLVGGLTSIVSGLLGEGLRLGQVRVTSLSATIDLTSVRSLLSASFGDPAEVLTIDPTDGRIIVDTGALLAAAYPQQESAQLNGLPPNTDLMRDPAIVTALTAALTSALAQWLSNVGSALSSALDALQVTAQATVSLNLLLPIARIDVAVSGRLADLRVGGQLARAELELLGLTLPVVTALLNGLLSALTTGFGPLVGNVVRGALSGLAAVPPAVTALTAPIVEAVSLVYSRLFLDGIVSVTVNAQNDPVSGAAEPADWAQLPEGRFDIAALRIGVLGALGKNDVHLYLGRGSVGPSCSLAELPLRCGDY